MVGRCRHRADATRHRGWAGERQLTQSHKRKQDGKNLLAAFADESQAWNKYTYFASVAKKEGYEQISAIFLKTAEQDKEHAKLHLKV